jgi:acyl-CoA reductase-like NAD-dependent aldehyde dehydrogenase
MKIINPANNQVLKEVNQTSASEIKRMLEAANKAQAEWKVTSLSKRLACIEKFHSLLTENIQSLAADLTAEVGKPLQESVNEVNGACKRIRFFLTETQKWIEQKEVNMDGNTREVLAYDPLGTIANISAWNYPFLVGVNVFIPALITGNCVLYKPSEFATLTGLNITKLLHQAGVPAAVFQCVVGAREAGEALLDLPLDGYFFTGSFKTGKTIAERVAHKLVPVGLELGGKDSLYVTDEIANLEQVADAVVEGCFYNNGQSCCAVERVYVHQKIYDQFMNLMEDRVRKLQVGSPTASNIQQGAVTRPVHLEFLEAQVKDALNKGAKLLVGGKKIAGPGSFFEPTLMVNVNHSMRLMKEETFGPLIGVMKIRDDEEAIKLMNDSDYGLTAAVYSKNIDRAKKVLQQVDTGTSYINCCDRVSAYLPWSGRRNSGLGSTLSYLGILAFTKPRGWHIRG